MGKVPVTFTEAALEILKNHTWPGNIRELENCIERLTIIASTAITPERLASCAVPGGGDASRPSAPGSAFPPISIGSSRKRNATSSCGRSKKPGRASQGGGTA
ncbi:MAG: hypothetical protein ACLSHC_17695 [Bilophila wadsworthia]